MKVENEEVRRSKIDYIYKRCYVDKHGNFVDPRTPWDELLKYHHHSQRVLINHDGNHAESVDHKARREVRAEKTGQQRKSRTSDMESDDLQRKTSERKLEARRRIQQLYAQSW